MTEEIPFFAFGNKEPEDNDICDDCKGQADLFMGWELDWVKEKVLKAQEAGYRIDKIYKGDDGISIELIPISLSSDK